MQIGDHLVTPRLGYTHHGLFVGDGSVIHYSGFAHGISSGVIEVTSLESFCDGNEVHVRTYKSRKHSRKVSVERAYSRLGEDWYNMLLNNCEHFVTWCITGQHSSSQVNNTVPPAGMAYVAVATMKTAPSLICDQGGLAGARSVAGLAGKAGVSALTKTSATTLVESVAPALASSGSGLVSSTLGVGSGVAAGVGASSVAGTAVGLVGVAGGTALSAVAVPVVASVAVAYGVKKLIDWIWD